MNERALLKRFRWAIQTFVNEKESGPDRGRIGAAWGIQPFWGDRLDDLDSALSFAATSAVQKPVRNLIQIESLRSRLLVLLCADFQC